MTLQAKMAADAGGLLRQLVARALARVPKATGNVSENTIAGNLLVCSSFLSSPTAETIDLCIEIEMSATVLVILADLVGGGHGEVLSELTPVTVSAGDEKVLTALDHYIRDQEDRIATLLVSQATGQQI